MVSGGVKSAVVSAGQRIDHFIFKGTEVHWDPNSYNALNGGTLGPEIPGVGNAATAPVKAAVKALAGAATMVGPAGDEEAAAIVFKDAEKVLQTSTENAAADGVAFSAPANRTAFEAYKDSLRAQMARPAVSDPNLSLIMDRAYREGATVGSGSTAAAVREELATGLPVKDSWHSQKARELIVNLKKWLNNNPDASAADRAAAENVILDLQNALNGQK